MNTAWKAIPLITCILVPAISLYFATQGHDWYHLLLEKSNIHLMRNMSENDQQYNDTHANIQDLTLQIREEVEYLQGLYSERDDIRDSWLWFLDYNKQEQYDQNNLQINDQLRLISNDMEDLQIQRKKVKPTLGLWSKAFLMDIAVSIAALLQQLTILVPPLGVSLSLLFLTPAMAALCLVYISIGITFIPVMTALLACVWIVNFPSLLLQYNPPAWQFALVYLLAVVVVLLFVFFIMGLVTQEALSFALPHPRHIFFTRRVLVSPASPRVATTTPEAQAAAPEGVPAM